MIKKITEVAFLFLLFGGSSNALAHHELANRNLSKGQKNYQSFCASCHGANLEGQPNWRDFKEDGSLPAPPHAHEGDVPVAGSMCAAPAAQPLRTAVRRGSSRVMFSTPTETTDHTSLDDCPVPVEPVAVAE